MRVDKEQVERWLHEELGLAFNPFQQLDAAKDPRLPSYLIGHQDFERLWGRWPAFLFAPAGGGKSAFRVRLARACRSEEGRRRFFPVTLYLPDPARMSTAAYEQALFDELCRSTGYELLFYLAHRAYQFPEWDEAGLRRLRQVLTETDIPVTHYLEQMEEEGSLQPLAEAFDLTALPMPQEPLPKNLRAFCAALREIPSDAPSPRPSSEKLPDLWKIIRQDLKQEAVFVLVDGVDAYPVPTEQAALLLEPLLKRIQEWATQDIYVKFFLPAEFHPLLRQWDLLTAPGEVAKIEWSGERLFDVLRERIRVASGGSFNSLKAMGNPRFRKDAEVQLVEAAQPRVPREVIYLAQLVLAEHVRRMRPRERLDPGDVEAALGHYQKEKGRYE